MITILSTGKPMPVEEVRRRLEPYLGSYIVTLRKSHPLYIPPTKVGGL